MSFTTPVPPSHRRAPTIEARTTKFCPRCRARAFSKQYTLCQGRRKYHLFYFFSFREGVRSNYHNIHYVVSVSAPVAPRVLTALCHCLHSDARLHRYSFVLKKLYTVCTIKIHIRFGKTNRVAEKVSYKSETIGYQE